MSLRQLLRPRKPFSLPTPLRHSSRHPLGFPRFNSTSPPPPPSKPQTQISRLIARLPKFLRPYVSNLNQAPISHIAAFLILHEITAIVPLVGLAGLFHYTEWLPVSWVEGKWVSVGLERFGRWFGRKGWFGFERGVGEEGVNGENEGQEGGDGGVGTREEMVEGVERKWRVGERGGRILVEVATAYAITKVFLPARILVSVWATPWFARVVMGRIRGVFRKNKL
ncbi:FLILHELTA domain containing protein [Hyaloscypha variabilis]